MNSGSSRCEESPLPPLAWGRCRVHPQDNQDISEPHCGSKKSQQLKA
ncbi:unnamed protein product [Gulo gulo]|uniref:Uncharacterized protein n=1 Tax=Gulo gulo TaxID=48420 RepID=A0A9X9LQR1_GULGU|nr:unnamed protein product [Gulo gulo]